MTCWYFGVVSGGHHLHAESGEWVRAAGPFAWTAIDCAHAPGPGQEQGAAALVHRDGYTLLAWWDRTGDRRPNSNSALIVDRICAAEEVLAEGRSAFPAVMARQTVAIEVVVRGERVTSC